MVDKSATARAITRATAVVGTTDSLTPQQQQQQQQQSATARETAIARATSSNNTSAPPPNGAHPLNKKKRSGGQFWRESQLSLCSIAEVNVNSNDMDIENEQVESVILKLGKESQMNILDNGPQYDDEYDNDGVGKEAREPITRLKEAEYLVKSQPYHYTTPGLTTTRLADDVETDDEADADDASTSTMMLSHNVTQSQINQNNHWDEESKFNYAYKFDYIYEALVHNVYYFSKKACSDLCMDEASWAYYGFSGPMVDYLKGKMFSRGGQTVILSDMDSDIFTKYAIPEIGKLWSSPPHLTADNFFNGDSKLDWMGGLGFGMIGSYFHKENVTSASAKRCLRVARLCNPVTIVKEVPTHAEAGSTGFCNIDSVNRLDSNGFFMHQKECGRGRGKSKWGIEMNHLGELYPLTNGKLDQIDSAISRSNIGYKSWNYYHDPINHAKTLVVITAFDMYQELTDDKAYPVDGLVLREATQSSTKQRLAWTKLNGRFCLEFDTEEYKEHHKSLCANKWRSRRNCYMCGAGCYTVCEKCVFGEKFVPLCKGDCFADYHSYKYFGLAKEELGKVFYG
eukprot:jgi/Psemu1/38329/gm1.38329_g